MSNRCIRINGIQKQENLNDIQNNYCCIERNILVLNKLMVADFIQLFRIYKKEIRLILRNLKPNLFLIGYVLKLYGTLFEEYAFLWKF